VWGCGIVLTDLTLLEDAFLWLAATAVGSSPSAPYEETEMAVREWLRLQIRTEVGQMQCAAIVLENNYTSLE
jgi:hypothetical protein